MRNEAIALGYAPPAIYRCLAPRARAAVTRAAIGCAANQVYYSVGERGPELSLLPWQRERGMPLMAYSPIDQGALASDAALEKMA